MRIITLQKDCFPAAGSIQDVFVFSHSSSTLLSFSGNTGACTLKLERAEEPAWGYTVCIAHAVGCMAL